MFLNSNVNKINYFQHRHSLEKAEVRRLIPNLSKHPQGTIYIDNIILFLLFYYNKSKMISTTSDFFSGMASLLKCTRYYSPKN